MVSNKPATIEDFLAALPEDRRQVMAKLRQLVKKSLPKGYEEQLGYGMICYVIPLDQYPKTYNGQPLCYVALAAQKNHYSLYLTGPYMQPEQAEALQHAFLAAGKKLDMGQSCLRFKKLEDLPLEAVEKVIGGIPPESFIESYETSRARPRSKSK
jgi:hypothetical protein